MIEKITKILTEANFAPSGDNCQPWKFKITPNGLLLFNLPEKDKSVYNFNQKAAYISHGAFIENIKIAALAHGLKTTINLFPDIKNPDLVAELDFSPSNGEIDNLYEFIEKRHTNRKPYLAKPISENQLSELLNLKVDSFDGKIVMVTAREHIKTLAQLLSINEKIVLQNKKLHQFLFGNISWGQEGLQKNDKMFIKTLEMNPLQQFVFKLCSSWKIMNFFDKFGLAKFISKENSKIYSNSGAIGAIITSKNSKTDFVQGGRLLQRTWLLATSMGLSLQPLAGMALLNQILVAGQRQALSPEHAMEIEDSIKHISTLINSGDENIIFMFRVGESSAPSAVTPRLPVEEILSK
ncbi:MAG: hypothetical protein HY918_00595 [Candidatus Doudnabacteria bacterium]|nr:hypothetical protein [Candidatus Doudnabacteria bacterium]